MISTESARAPDDPSDSAADARRVERVEQALDPRPHTIDELASRTRVPTRTIRFYQSKGALMAPEIRGRVAYYGPAHVERLKLIAQLQDRGLRIDAIADLTKRIDRDELDIAEWLGVEAQMKTPWADDRPRTVTEQELYALAGVERPGLIADLVRAKVVERRGDTYLVASPALFSLAMKLDAAGIDLDTARAASDILRKHLGRAVSDLLSLFFARVKDGHFTDLDPEKLFETFRAVGMDSVQLLFARDMERALRKMSTSGKVTWLSARPKGAKPKK